MIGNKRPSEPEISLENSSDNQADQLQERASVPSVEMLIRADEHTDPARHPSLNFYKENQDSRSILDAFRDYWAECRKFWSKRRILRFLRVFFVQVICVTVFFLIYTFARQLGVWIYKDQKAVAFRHLDQIVKWEKSWGFYNELQIALVTAFHTSYAWKVFISNWYLIAHFGITPIFYAWVVLWRPKEFPIWGTGLMFGSLFACISFVLYPLAPPRMLPEFPDILSIVGIDPHGENSTVKTLANPYAAMPSLHFGWSFYLGISGFILTRKSFLAFRMLGSAWMFFYPGFMLYIIVGTSNHFWLDAVFGGIAMALGIFCSYLGFYKLGWRNSIEKYPWWNVDLRFDEERVSNDDDRNDSAADAEEQGKLKFPDIELQDLQNIEHAA